MPEISGILESFRYLDKTFHICERHECLSPAMNNTLIKGLRLLEVLAAQSGPVGIAELAAQLQIARSNVHRLLQALVEMGYASNVQGQYRTSIKVWELGARALSQLDFREAAGPAMRSLLAQSNETVHLSVLSGEEVVYIDKLDSPEPVRAYSVIGGRAPAYCVATGKVLLAWREASAANSMAVRQLPAFTPATLADSADLARELDRVRRQGYAVNRGEWRASVWGIAAPIFGPSGQVLAAIGISGPATRLRARGMRALSAQVVQAAAQASGELARASQASG